MCRRIKADPGIHVAQLRLRHDAGAASGKLGIDAFKDVDSPSVVTERERREQPAHRAADHQRPPSMCSAYGHAGTLSIRRSGSTNPHALLA